MQSNGSLSLAIALTADYALPAAVLLKSVLDNTSARLEVYALVKGELGKDVIDGWESMAPGRVNVVCVSPGNHLKDSYIDPKFTEASWYRVLLPELLSDLDEVLYIDCDIIVRQDMALLYDRAEMSDKYLAGVCERSGYVNAGVLLMNLTKMREDGITQRLLEASKVDYLEFPDQDVLNEVCKGKILSLSPLYNGIRTFFLPQFRADFEKLHPGMWDAVQTSANIHYTGEKPWRGYTVKFGEWWKVYRTLPKNLQAWYHPSPKMRFLGSLYRCSAVETILEGMRNLYRKIFR